MSRARAALTAVHEREPEARETANTALGLPDVPEANAGATAAEVLAAMITCGTDLDVVAAGLDALADELDALSNVPELGEIAAVPRILYRMSLRAAALRVLHERVVEGLRAREVRS